MPRLPASPSALSICETSQLRNVLLPWQPLLAGSAFIPPRTAASLLLSLRPEQGLPAGALRGAEPSEPAQLGPRMGQGVPRAGGGRLAKEEAVT